MCCPFVMPTLCFHWWILHRHQNVFSTVISCGGEKLVGALKQQTACHVHAWRYIAALFWHITQVLLAAVPLLSDSCDWPFFFFFFDVMCAATSRFPFFFFLFCFVPPGLPKDSYLMYQLTRCVMHCISELFVAGDTLVLFSQCACECVCVRVCACACVYVRAPRDAESRNNAFRDLWQA